MTAFDALIARSIPLVPRALVRRFSRPYIAGERTEDMLKTVRALNEDGFVATVDILGEFSTTKEQAEQSTNQYAELMDRFATEGLDSKISVKLTQLGLTLDRELAYENVKRLVAKAEEQGRFVRIDMEDSSCTSDTLEIYTRLQRELGHRVGPVIQAYLRRSLSDVRRLVELRANVRLCKGIYIEPRAIAYHDGEIINRNFVRLLDELLRGGCYVGIATHDERLVWEAFRLIDELGIPTDRYEFQMLLGVDEPLRRLIRDAGHRVRVYVPYGRKWYEYSVRRLRENPRIAGYVVKAMLGTG
jgi:proline dehydrogenase